MRSNSDDFGFSALEMTLFGSFLFVMYVAGVQDHKINPQKQENAGFSQSLAEVWGNFSADKAARVNRAEQQSLEVFANLTDQFSQQSGTTGQRFSSDERRYFDQILRQMKNRTSGHQMTKQEMASVLKSAAITYSRTQTLAENLGLSDLSLQTWDSEEAEAFFSGLERDFGVSTHASRTFAQQHPSSIGDWAFFIEMQMD